MDKKYSPAPWRETENDDGDFLVVMDKAHSVVIGNLEGSCATCHANSRLISVSPELLEALERLLDRYEKGNLQLIDWYHAVQVIQKATGQT